MSAARPWLAFSRRGGMPPRDDESLRLTEAGSFTAHRTIGGPRIGLFEGRLAARPLARLQAAIEPLREASDVEIPTPHRGATETLEAAGHTIRLGSNETPPKPWRAAIRTVRAALDDVDDSPTAAIGLVATMDRAQLVHAGTAPVAVNLGSVTVSAVHLADDGIVVDRWTGRVRDEVSNGEELVDRPEWLTAGPGWALDLPFDHGQVRAVGEWLQVWVALEFRDAHGQRDGRLYVPVVPGG